MGTERKFIWSNMVLTKLRNHGKILLFVGREKKGQAAFSPIVLSAAEGGVPEKLERKNFMGGPAKRVRMGRVGGEGLPDFRRGLGLMPKLDIIIYKSYWIKKNGYHKA